MNQKYSVGDQEELFLQLLRPEEIDEAAALCDYCVGKNLYKREELAKAITHKDHFFFLLKTVGGENAGYIYYHLTNLETLAKQAKLPAGKFEEVCPMKNTSVGKLQSIGLLEKYRKRGLAARMIRFALDDMRKISVGTVFTVCWKNGGGVALERALLECDFSYLAGSKMTWHDVAELICPVCGGRCFCDAEIYYKHINQEESNET